MPVGYILVRYFGGYVKTWGKSAIKNIINIKNIMKVITYFDTYNFIDELINYKINGYIFVWIDGKRGFYKFSSSSGSAVSWVAMYFSSCFFCHWGSI